MTKVNWLLGLLGLLPRCPHDRDSLMDRVRTASDEHTVEAAQSSQRVDQVIFNTRHSDTIKRAEAAIQPARVKAVEELLRSRDG